MSKAVLTRTRDVFAGSTKWRRAALIAVAITALFLPAQAVLAATLDLNRTTVRCPSRGARRRWVTTKGVPSSPLTTPSGSQTTTRTGSTKSTRRPESSSGRLAGARSTTPGGSAADPGRGRKRTNDFEAIAYNRRDGCALRLLRRLLHLLDAGEHGLPTQNVGRGAFGSRRTSLCPLVPTEAGAACSSPTASSTWGRARRCDRSTTRRAPRAHRWGVVRGPRDPWNGFLARRGGSLRHGEQRTADPDRLGDEEGRERVDIRSDAVLASVMLGRWRGPGAGSS